MTSIRQYDWYVSQEYLVTLQQRRDVEDASKKRIHYTKQQCMIGLYDVCQRAMHYFIYIHSTVSIWLLNIMANTRYDASSYHV